MKYAIVGASKGMGRALARELVQAGHQICLMGRDLDDLRKSAADLSVRGGTNHEPHVAVVHCDLDDAHGLERAVAEADERLGGMDGLIITAALFGTQDALEADTLRATQLLTVNVAHTIALAEYARKTMMARGSGMLVLFSSVAGDRGRKPVGIYGASKAALSHYAESLDHKYASQGLVTICVKPGFVRTGMTEGLKPPPFAGNPEDVAVAVVAAMKQGRPMVYTPWIWGWVMFVIKRLPRFVMRKIGF